MTRLLMIPGSRPGTVRSRQKPQRRKSRRSATKSMRCRKGPSAGQRRMLPAPVSSSASDTRDGSRSSERAQEIARQRNSKGSAKTTKDRNGVASDDLPAALIETLTAHRTAALRTMLAATPARHLPRCACGSPSPVLRPVRRRKLPRAQTRQRRFTWLRGAHRGQPCDNELCPAPRLVARPTSGTGGRLVGLAARPGHHGPAQSDTRPTAPLVRSMPSRNPTSSHATRHPSRLAR